MSRILAVDPGEVRIGLALSDPTRLIARPLSVLRHTSRQQDALAIARAGREHAAGLILVGLALDQEGLIGAQARRGLRLAEAIRGVTDVPVGTWDESGTTQQAQALRGGGQLLDAQAAAFLLQDYLDSQGSQAAKRPPSQRPPADEGSEADGQTG